MAIIRAERPQSNFYILDKRISEDGTLTWAARGLLIFLLGKPDHWKVSIEHLRGESEASRKPSGRDALYAMLDELIAAGYVKRTINHKADGTLNGYDYVVYDEPVTLGDAEDAPCPGLPDTVAPCTGLPCTAEPSTANPTLVNTDTKQRRKKARTEDIAPMIVADLEGHGISLQAATEWLAIRKKKRLPLTPLAWQSFQLEAGKAGWTLQDAVLKCIARGWATFEAEWVRGSRGGGYGGGKQAEWDRTTAEFLGHSEGGRSDDGFTLEMQR